MKSEEKQEKPVRDESVKGKDEVQKEKRIRQLKDQAVDYALAHGLLMRQTVPRPSDITLGEKNQPSLVTHAPFALLPTPFPEDQFAAARQLQPLFNRLIHSVSKDTTFLHQALSGLGKVDPFTGSLYTIYLQVLKEGILQPHTLGIHRSDYLLHSSSSSDTSPGIKQVEINTIAASFSSLSGLTSKLHRYLMERTGFYDLTEPKANYKNLPENESSESIGGALATAWKAYNVPNALVIMVVQPGETNAFDQRRIEYSLWKHARVKMLRCTLVEMLENCKLVGLERRLVYETEELKSEVAVVYFRAGYTPRDYPSSLEWDSRLLIERSFAIKCPSIAHHLVGSKKIQQILAQPGMVERFMPNPDDVARIRDCFVGLYPLDASCDGIEALKKAMDSPELYVVKPQREGGGNNIYGHDIRTALSNMDEEERSAYILMELIHAPTTKNILVRNGESFHQEVVSELGIYGFWLSKEVPSQTEQTQVICNEVGGHLLRTKMSSSNEGGVAAGFAVLDSPLLI